MNSRRAAQSVHFKARVIRQRIKRAWSDAFLRWSAFPGHPFRHLDGFLRSIPCKRAGIFDHLGHALEIVQRLESKALSQDGADFADFVSVSRGNEQGDHALTG